MGKATYSSHVLLRELPDADGSIAAAGEGAATAPGEKAGLVILFRLALS
jgi:hypothetical protein